MGVGGAIAESSELRSLPWLVRAVMATGAAITVGVVALVALSVRAAPASRTAASWLAHHHECHKLPEELYHRDRFRAILGHVADEDGKPVAGASVRCVRLENLVELKAGPPSPLSWSIPIEAETKTDERGQYEFPHLPVGGRTFFYSAPARDLAPVVRDLVVVEDGLGAQLDVRLIRPSVLRVKVTAGRAPSLLIKGAARAALRSARGAGATRLHVIPHRWWPDLITAAIPAGREPVEFSGLGGPLRKGLIAASGADQRAPLWVIGRYDLDESGETVVTRGAPGAASRFDLPEAAGIELWSPRMRASQRLFYAAMSPIALFWPVVGDDQPLWQSEPAHPLRTPPSKICLVGHGRRPRFRAAPVLAGAGRIANRRGLAGVGHASDLTGSSRGTRAPGGGGPSRSPGKAAPPEPTRDAALQLVRVEGKDERVVWTFHADVLGKFAVTNVGHGRYDIRLRGSAGEKRARSVQFDIGEGASDATVRWSS
jgi:hypothetical protein